MLTSVPKKQRAALTPQQTIKLKTKCKEALQELYFNFLTHDNSCDLSSLLLYLVQMKVEELCQALMADVMHRIFAVPSMMCLEPTGNYNFVPAAVSQTIDMLNSI